MNCPSSSQSTGNIVKAAQYLQLNFFSCIDEVRMLIYFDVLNTKLCHETLDDAD